MRNKTWIALALAVCIGLAGCKREEIATPTGVTCAVDYSTHPNGTAYGTALDGYVAGSQAPGSVIGVKRSQDSPWVGARGFSNLESGTAFEPCTQFRCGSITKVFTAVIVMQLVEDSLISLDDAVLTVLPEVADRIPKAESITVRHLLNHSSGLGHPTDDDVNFQLSLINNPGYIADMDFRERLEEYVFDKPLNHEPGTESYYSNAGYWLLGWIIEKVSGETLQHEFEQRITGPLVMGSTYLDRRENSNLSRGYNFSGSLLKDVSMWDGADSDGDPAAGLVSNAEDLLVFGEALFLGNLVSPSSLAEMKVTTSFPSCNGDCGYGLGIETWETTNYSGFGKNGSSLGVDANIIFFPDQETTIVLFSNYGGGNRKDVLETLLEL